MATDYIKRADVADEIEKICQNCIKTCKKLDFCTPDCESGCGILDLKSKVAAIPAADAVDVVYCKDCKHSDTFSPDCTEATFPLKCLSVRYGGVFPLWFCEHGERNGGADDA